MKPDENLYEQPQPSPNLTVDPLFLVPKKILGMETILVGLVLQELMIILLILLLGPVATIFWIWMLIDCATKEPSGNGKVVWIIIIAVTHLIGALIYFFVRRPKRSA